MHSGVDYSVPLDPSLPPRRPGWRLGCLQRSCRPWPPRAHREYLTEFASLESRENTDSLLGPADARVNFPTLTSRSVGGALGGSLDGGGAMGTGFGILIFSPMVGLRPAPTGARTGRRGRASGPRPMSYRGDREEGLPHLQDRDGLGGRRWGRTEDEKEGDGEPDQRPRQTGDRISLSSLPRKRLRDLPARPPVDDAVPPWLAGFTAC